MRRSKVVGRQRVPVLASAACLFVTGVCAAAQSVNQPPKISGRPATWVYAGSQYSFRPSVSDREGAKLRFTIANKPAWASFSTSLGRLAGTPAAVGYWPGIQIRVSDGRTSVALPAFSIRAASRSNVAPTISGRASRTAVVGSAYSFQPKARDANGDPVSFRIANRPAWASFSSKTGRLSGTPGASCAGTYSNIVISVSDGARKVSLPAFSITVDDASIGGASLSWLPPTRNADGSTLTNLAGYRIYYGRSALVLVRTIQIANPGISTYVIENLLPGTYCFAVRAYTRDGNESANSNISTEVVQ